MSAEGRASNVNEATDDQLQRECEVAAATAVPENVDELYGFGAWYCGLCKTPNLASLHICQGFLKQAKCQGNRKSNFAGYVNPDAEEPCANLRRASGGTRWREQARIGRLEHATEDRRAAGEEATRKLKVQRQNAAARHRSQWFAAMRTDARKFECMRCREGGLDRWVSGDRRDCYKCNAPRPYGRLAYRWHCKDCSISNHPSSPTFHLNITNPGSLSNCHICNKPQNAMEYLSRRRWIRKRKQTSCGRSSSSLTRILSSA